MQYLVKVLEHHEVNPSLSRLRHPIVVLFHLPFVVSLLSVYFIFTHQTVGQTIYFMVAGGLYLSSAAYHTWKPNWFLRFVDQTMISWYIVVIPMPFIYQESWSLPLISVFLVLTALNKWYDWEPNASTGAMVFFGLGSISAFIVLLLGLPIIGAPIWSVPGFWVIASAFCFIGKLIIYQYRKLHLVPNVWESPESGHMVLSLGVSIYTSVVVLYPV